MSDREKVDELAELLVRQGGQMLTMKAEIERLRASAEQDDRLRVTCLTLRDEARQEAKRLRAALTRIAEGTDKAANVVGLDIATALVFDEFSRIAAKALAGTDEQPGHLEPHAYVPSPMHQGDCAVCGHVQGSAIHEQSADPDEGLPTAEDVRGILGPEQPAAPSSGIASGFDESYFTVETSEQSGPDLGVDAKGNPHPF